MTRSVDERLSDILNAVARARVADKRLRLADSLGDAAGEQIAFQAMLHNVSVIGDAVAGIPADVRDGSPDVPWGAVDAAADAIGRDYQRIDPAVIHRAMESELASLEAGVRRLRASRRGSR